MYNKECPLCLKPFIAKRPEAIFCSSKCRWEDWKTKHGLSILVPYVYFIQDERGYVKIGVSWQPEERLKDLQTSNPHRLSILCCIKGGFEVEKKLHNFLSNTRAHGEWFHHSEKLSLLLEAIAQDGGLKIDLQPTPIAETPTKTPIRKYTHSHPRKEFHGPPVPVKKLCKNCKQKFTVTDKYRVYCSFSCAEQSWTLKHSHT